MLKFTIGGRFNGDYILLDYTRIPKPKASQLVAQRALVLCVVHDDSGSIRDHFVSWECNYDEHNWSCSWGNYSSNIDEALAIYRERCRQALERVTNEDALYQRGKDDGSTAASWIVDGNTPDPIGTLEKILKGIEDGDPQTMDLLPAPRIGGEWADDPTWEDILKAEIDEYNDESLFEGVYDELEDDYSQGFQEGVELQLRHKLSVYQRGGVAY